MQAVSRANLSRQVAERRIILLKAEMKSRDIGRFAVGHRSGNSGATVVEGKAPLSTTNPV